MKNIEEDDLDSSKNEYREIVSKEDNKQSTWDMAVGLQQVDNLKTSDYMNNLIDDNVNNKLTIEDVLNELQKYYSKKEKSNIKEKEADLVSARIYELMVDDNFELSIDYLEYIHKYLFQDIYDFAGKIRQVNMTKSELILAGDTVIYAPYDKIRQSLEYDMIKEQNKDYTSLNIRELIDEIVKFTSNIWQVHPFREGNTRTTVVFIIKYLNHLGYNVDNTLFKNKSVYFRNALVRSNYYNEQLGISTNYEYLKKFFENLLLGKNNELHSRDLIVKELFNEENKMLQSIVLDADDKLPSLSDDEVKRLSSIIDSFNKAERNE